MDVTFSARMRVEAENEEQAKEKAIREMEKDPRYHTRFGAYVDTEVTDIYEEVEG
jgi:hypothetical protein